MFIRKYILIILLSTICLLLLSCEDDTVDCPVGPGSEEIGDYNFYTSLFGADNDWGYEVYVYNTKSQAIVDSFDLGDFTTELDIEVTADERYLIASANDSSEGTIIYDMVNREVALSLPYIGSVETSPGGKYIAVESWRLHLFDAQTLEELPIDSVFITGGEFSPDGEMFIGKDSSRIIRRFDISGDSLLPDIHWNDSAQVFAFFEQIVPTHDPNKIFMKVAYYETRTDIMSYYIAEDSIGLHYLLPLSQKGTMVLTPDGSQLIFTDPYDTGNVYASRSIFIVDALTDKVTAQIGPAVDDENGNHLWLNPTDIAITPDSKLMFFGGPGTNWQPLINISTRRYLDLTRIDPVSGFGWSVACPK